MIFLAVGSFAASATVSGQNITIGITDNIGGATFQCQLDNQPFVSCKNSLLFPTALSLCISTATGADGFVYTSVAVGDHNITVRGTTQDGQVGELNLGPLTISSSFMITAVASSLGTTITVIIDATEDATFECQLDDSNFVPCEWSTTAANKIYKHPQHFLVLQAYQAFSTQEYPLDHTPLGSGEPALKVDK